MPILRFAIEVLDVGCLVSDTTHDRDEFDEVNPDLPVAAFANGDLESGLSYIRDSIKRHEAEVARHLAEAKARAAGSTVVPGPGWKPADALPPAQPDAPLHTAVLSANGHGTTLVDLHGTDESVLIRWGDRTVHFHGQPETVTRPVKTDREIVDEVNAVALKLSSHRGFEPHTGNYEFWRSGRKDVRALTAWKQAAEIYEQITGSEVSDALQAVLEEEEAATAPAMPAEPVS
jgi:hypothetical protein